MDGFKNTLNYSTCNEDSLSEINALKIIETDEILCITGSGGRVLNLLTENPKKIIAVDFNPTQNWLLELKIAAMRNLNYIQFSKFIGLRKCKDRLELFKAIEHNLTKACLRYWKRNKRSIIKGVLYQGKLERFLKYFSNVIKESMCEKVDEILSFTDLEEQKKYYEEEWKNDPNWTQIANFFSSKIREADPTYDLYVDKDHNFEDFIFKILEKGFNSHLIRNNHFLCLIIDGNYERVLKLPICLQEEKYNIIKNNLHKIKIVTCDIVTYLKNSEVNTIDKFSISDVGGYLSDKQYDKLYEYMINSSKINSIFCARNIVAKRSIPSKYSKFIKRETALEKKLNKEDLALEYEIIIGKISK